MLNLRQSMRDRIIRAIDVFGFLAAVIGLVADFYGLGGLVSNSNVEQSDQFFIWAFLFLSVTYSIALVNFFSRKHLYSSHQEGIKLSPSSIYGGRVEDIFARKFAKNLIGRVESGTESVTYLVGIPAIICFVCAAFYVDGANSSFDRVFGSLFIFSSRVEYTLSGALIGWVVGFALCWLVNRLVVQVFMALESAYDIYL